MVKGKTSDQILSILVDEINQLKEIYQELLAKIFLLGLWILE